MSKVVGPFLVITCDFYNFGDFHTEFKVHLCSSNEIMVHNVGFLCKRCMSGVTLLEKHAMNYSYTVLLFFLFCGCQHRDGFVLLCMMFLGLCF